MTRFKNSRAKTFQDVERVSQNKAWPNDQGGDRGGKDGGEVATPIWMADVVTKKTGNSHRVKKES